MTITPEILRALRCAAGEGARVSELVALAQALLGSRGRIPVIACFYKAFRIPLMHAKELGAWDGLGGTWSDDELEERLGPRIRSSLR